MELLRTQDDPESKVPRHSFCDVFGSEISFLTKVPSTQ